MMLRRVVAGLLLLTACRTGGGPPPASAPSARPRPFRVVGYLPSWRGPDVAIPYQRLTHLNYAFALPTPSGGLTDVPRPDRLAAVVTAAHASGVKVCLSIGGWHDGDDSAFERMAADAGARAAFVEAGMAVVAAHDLDGLDVDWEYPDPGPSAVNFVRLMAELAARLHPSGKLLTTAVVALGAQGEGILPEVFASTDFVNVMAYDADETGRTHHSPYEYAVASLRYWRGRGLPRDQLVLGVPFYGRPPSTSYRELFRVDPRAHEKDQIGTIGYNGIATIKRKTTLAQAEASGIMIWEITEDTSDETSLLRAIDEVSRPGAQSRADR